jgi:alkylhydroperoxidase family enzyme
MIDAIPNADPSPLFSDEEKAVVAGSTELSRTAKLSDATFKRLRGFFDDRALMELVINTSIANMNNRITDSFIADLEP